MKNNPCLSSLMLIATIILAITVSCSIVDSSEVQAHATVLDGFRESLGPPSPRPGRSFHHWTAPEHRSERAATGDSD
ncbi:unnamed protein product [Urochloa decumbens]|uniref:Transmembrane protein n=1 Tax=Urochloa decumbens TaxID=240449 RepID=A0ABC8YVJ5_9POAL